MKRPQIIFFRTLGTPNSKVMVAYVNRPAMGRIPAPRWQSKRANPRITPYWRGSFLALPLCGFRWRGRRVRVKSEVDAENGTPPERVGR